MKVLIDATEIRLNRLYSSIPLYIKRLLTTIEKEKRKDYILLINKECICYFKENFPDYQFIIFKFFGWHPIFRKNPLYLYCQYKFNKVIKRNKFDIVFIPTDFPLYLQDKLCCKKIVVIHDLKEIKRNCYNIKESIKSYFLNRMYNRHLESCDKIIAISKYTKQDINIYFPNIDNDKIHVIYNSVLLPEYSLKPAGFKEKKFILYVNTLNRYKNILTLIRSFIRIAEEVDHKLVIVGKKTVYWNNHIEPLLAKGNVKDRIIHLSNLKDEELRYLYENASLFVTPSLNEGFGYTPIEAAICKCPVLSSIQEALPDSTKGLVNYYQPAMDDETLANKMIQILKNPPSIEELEIISQFFIESYSPDKQKKMIKQLFENSINIETNE